VEQQQVQALIDGLGQAQALDHELDGAEPAVAQAVTALGKFKVDVAGGKLWPIAAGQPAFVEAALDPPLAVAPDSAYFGSHSKSLLASGDEKASYFLDTGKAQGISRVFFF